MNSTRKILSVFIALTFLVSTAGVFYVKHTCLHTGETTVLLVEKVDCNGHSMDKTSCCDELTEKGTCSLQGEHKNCCLYDMVYLKGDSEYQKSESRYSIDRTDYQLFEIRIANNIASAEKFLSYSVPLPPYNPPKDVLIKNGILIL